jgi:dipeptidyl aminopeptidase/acylaminoacyl peptidase
MKRARPADIAARLILPAVLAVLLAGTVYAQESVLTQEAYMTPPPEIAELVLAPRHENVTLSNRSPDGKYFLRTLSDGLPSIDSYAKEFYRLGGLQIDPEANRSRRFTTRNSVGFELIDYETGNTVRIQVPRDARVSNPQWSPDGSQLAYYAHWDDATHIYVADTSTGRSTRLTPARVPAMPTLMTSFEWTADGQYILATLVPDRMGDEPAGSPVPTTPMVRLTEEGENKLRVYASLLEDPHEMALVEHFVTTQLALINVRNRRVQNIGEPGMCQRTDISPGGQHIRVTRMEKPFSYIVPVSSFGNREEVWDLGGNVLTELAQQDLRTGISGNNQNNGNNQNDKRSISWRPDGAGLSYLQIEPRERRERGEEEEQEPAEEEEEEAPRKDRLMLWVAPFDSTSTSVVYESETRMGGVSYSEDGQVLFIREGGGGGGRFGGGGGGGGGGGTSKLYAVYLDDPETQYPIFEWRSSDFYENPGSLQMKRGPLGVSVVRMSSDGRFVYLSGTRYSEDPLENAPRPFIDKVEIRTGEKTNVWTSAEDMYETVSQIMDDDLTQLMITRQSPTMVPDSYLLDVASGTARKLTNNRDFAPDITNAIRERFQVTRVDGFKFWVNVTLPASYVEGTRLPAMFWFYPREYTSQENYDEGLRRYNKNTFPRTGTRSMDYLLRLGYAYVSPDCPIVGTETNNRNDNYVQDLRNSLTAVIDALDQKEYIDRDRLAIGGHSYGAFGTANAMIQTPYFKAGIAGDGNYNRTLTPLGFQSERRELWEGREVYLSMSPLLWANQLNGALLMYHGMDDQNVGTAPFHAPKFFHSLNGLGKTAALYMYPYEDHGPATKETTLDLWARWVAWLDKYVMNAGQETEETETTRPRGRRGGGN